MDPLNRETKKRGGAFSIRVYIPPHLQSEHRTKTGNPKTEIVRALGTGDRKEARQRAPERLLEIVREKSSETTLFPPALMLSLSANTRGHGHS